ncbi:MAG: hypothetical protein QXX68_01080 [Candidatus Pacearchaeota archaeon]
MNSRLTEQQKKEIEEQSKQLLVEFNRKLEKLKFNGEIQLSEKARGRVEKTKNFYSEDFRRIFFKNAHEKNENSLIAERGSWK